MAILEKMSARRPRFPGQEVLERIWNDSGDKEDLDSEETSKSEVESSELASEDESSKNFRGGIPPEPPRKLLAFGYSGLLP